MPIQPCSVLKDLNSFSPLSHILTVSMLAVLSLEFFNSSIVEFSNPTLVTIISSAKLLSRDDTKIIDEINNNEKSTTEYEPITMIFYYLQLNLNEN